MWWAPSRFVESIYGSLVVVVDVFAVVVVPPVCRRRRRPRRRGCLRLISRRPLVVRATTLPKSRRTRPQYLPRDPGVASRGPCSSLSSSSNAPSACARGEPRRAWRALAAPSSAASATISPAYAPNALSSAAWRRRGGGAPRRPPGLATLPTPPERRPRLQTAQSKSLMSLMTRTRNYQLFL